MPKTDPAHARPSWVSLALIVGSSLAVIVMAGWLAMMIVASKSAGTADPVDAAAFDAASPPHVENAEPGYVPPMLPSAMMTNATGGGAAASDASAAGAAGPRLSSLGSASTSAVAAVPTSIGGPGDLLNVDPPEAADPPSAIVPLPLRRPRRSSSPVPVPRSRPPINNVEAQPQRGWSLFDLFVDRQH